MAARGNDQFLQALQGLAHRLHKPVPTKVVRRSGYSPTEDMQYNIQLLVKGRVSINTTELFVPSEVAAAVLIYFGAEGSEVGETTVSGSRIVERAEWLADFQ